MKYLSLIPLLFIVAACHKRNNECPTNTSQYQQVSVSAKDWFPYTGNGNLIFENAAQKTDTLQLKNYFFGDGDIWLGDECPLAKGQFLRGDIIDAKTSDTISTEIGYGDQVRIKKSSGSLLYYDTKSVLILPSDYRKFQSTASFNNKTYSLVLGFECSPTDKCIATGITKFYFSKTRGLVAYERAGVLWTLK